MKIKLLIIINVEINSDLLISRECEVLAGLLQFHSIQFKYIPVVAQYENGEEKKIESYCIDENEFRLMPF
jgi:hypothetical protein